MKDLSFGMIFCRPWAGWAICGLVIAFNALLRAPWATWKCHVAARLGFDTGDARFPAGGYAIFCFRPTVTDVPSSLLAFGMCKLGLQEIGKAQRLTIFESSVTKRARGVLMDGGVASAFCHWHSRGLCSWLYTFETAWRNNLEQGHMREGIPCS